MTKSKPDEECRECWGMVCTCQRSGEWRTAVLLAVAIGLRPHQDAGAEEHDWDGQRLKYRVDLPVADVLYEIARYLVADEGMREMEDYGRGEAEQPPGEEYADAAAALLSSVLAAEFLADDLDAGENFGVIELLKGEKLAIERGVLKWEGGDLRAILWDGVREIWKELLDRDSAFCETCERFADTLLVAAERDPDYSRGRVVCGDCERALRRTMAWSQGDSPMAIQLRESRRKKLAQQERLD